MVELRPAIISLAEQEVKFVIIGGVAINLHSSAYVTEDFDFCFSRERENLKRIVKALAFFRPRLRGFPKDLPFVWDEQTLLGGTNFTPETEIGDIDLLGEVKGIGNYSDVEKESTIMSLFGFDIKVFSIEGLIKAKRAAGRTKDLLVLPELEGL
jgi:predicted nucleotidyltransferase